MKKGALAIESSTLTPSWTRELGGEAAQRGVAFLEAPVVGSRPQAEAAKLVYFVGGDEPDLKRAERVLKAMGESRQRRSTGDNRAQPQPTAPRTPRRSGR